jgi:hypothetical protein
LTVLNLYLTVIAMRWQLIALGLLLLVAWFAFEAMTVVPGSGAELDRWAMSNASIFLAGIAFGAAIRRTLPGK